MSNVDKKAYFCLREDNDSKGKERIKEKVCINIFFPDAALRVGVDLPVEIRHLEEII